MAVIKTLTAPKRSMLLLEKSDCLCESRPRGAGTAPRAPVRDLID